MRVTCCMRVAVAVASVAEIPFRTLSGGIGYRLAGNFGRKLWTWQKGQKSENARGHFLQNISLFYYADKLSIYRPIREWLAVTESVTNVTSGALVIDKRTNYANAFPSLLFFFLHNLPSLKSFFFFPGQNRAKVNSKLVAKLIVLGRVEPRQIKKLRLYPWRKYVTSFLDPPRSGTVRKERAECWRDARARHLRTRPTCLSWTTHIKVGVLMSYLVYYFILT